MCWKKPRGLTLGEIMVNAFFIISSAKSALFQLNSITFLILAHCQCLLYIPMTECVCSINVKLEINWCSFIITKKKYTASIIKPNKLASMLNDMILSWYHAIIQFCLGRIKIIVCF